MLNRLLAYRAAAASATLLRTALVCLAMLGLSQSARAQQKFSELIGPVTVGDVKTTGPMQVPFITWGGDVATFRANGGLTTQKGSLFDKQGLKLQLVAGDDFVGQVRRYLAGETPFIRGTLGMLGMASEVLGSNPKTKPVVFVQMTWSVGDHMVGRAAVKNLNDLKGKKIALQRGGPHVGLLDEILLNSKLTWTDITPVWTDDLTGAKGPAEAFRKDPSIDCCMVISPDMMGLTGGLEAIGTGAEGTLEGAHVVVSTANMNRAVADVYACRKDYFDAHRDVVEKFTAAYLRACEEVVDLKNQYNESGNSAEYTKILKMTQQIYGEAVIPTEVDAHGLISDCTFAGLPVNTLFFTQKGNLNGFDAKQKAALDLAVQQGYAGVRTGFFPPNWDYDHLKQLGGLKAVLAEGGPDVDSAGGDVIYSFTIDFEPNQDEFPPEVYGTEFEQVIQLSSSFGNAVIEVTGHADPTRVLREMVTVGMEKGLLRRSGSKGDYKYFFQGKPLSLEDTPQIMQLINGGAFDGGSVNPRETMQAALNLSQARAMAVKEAIIGYAKGKNYVLDSERLTPVGIGITDPLIKKPQTDAERRQNMRVEFRLKRVSAEGAVDFDF